MPQTTSSIERSQAGHVVGTSLVNADPYMITDKLLTKIALPKNAGSKIFFRRANLLPKADTPLAEGVTPGAKALSYTRYEATPDYYGDIIEITDVVTDMVDDPVLTDCADIMSKQIAETKEAINFSVLKSGTSIYYDDSAHTQRNEVDSKLTYPRLQLVQRTMQRDKARTITKMQKSTTAYGTRSIKGSYVVLAHTDLRQDIEALPGYIDAADYGTQELICEHEIGQVGVFRFVLSPEYEPYEDAGGLASTNGLKTTSGTQADVYPMVVMGEDCAACIPLQGKDAIKPTIIRPDVVEKSDVLGRTGYCGWKICTTALITNQLWLSVLEVGCSDL